MNDLPVIYLNGGKAFPKGSRPPSLEHQFLDENDLPYDMSVGVWTGQAKAEQLHVTAQPPNIGSGSVSVNAVDAKVTYGWASADFNSIGRFRIILWVGNGSQRFGSTIYEWEVADAPGDDPTV